MINRSIALCLFVIGTVCISAQAQTIPADSIVNQHDTFKTWSRVIAVPALLITSGSLAVVNNTLIDRYEIAEERNEVTPYFHTHIDNYLQFAPIVAVYALNAAGIKGEHDFTKRTILLLKTELIMAAIVYPLKKITAVPRPDTGTPNSFPSGHAAQAFAAATFLHKEFGKQHPLCSILAYGTATGVGVIRVLNNRHWASDVLVGAGIGILSTNLAYLTHENKKGKKYEHLSNLMASPTYGQRSFGMYMSMRVR